MLSLYRISVLLVVVFWMFGAQIVRAEGQAFEIPRSITHSLKAEASERSYDLYVKLPAGYDLPENSERHYPVIYLTDGPYTFQVASGTTRLPMGAKKMESAILVAMSQAKNESAMAARVFDLTPVEDPSWTKYKTGGAPVYFDFLSQQVIPLIEKEYRADPQKRTLSGQSLGGSFGAWVLLVRPGVFSTYILTSPSLWYKDGLIFDLEKAYAKTHVDLAAKVYFAVGSEETLAKGMNYPMMSQLNDFTAILESRGYPSLELKTEIISGAVHETTFPQGFIRGMQWIYMRP